jgi:hypothetical protein
MERAAFLIEETGERISCMLNPDNVTLRRRAGIRTRDSLNGPLAASGLGDDPLLFTGGGSTELQLDLLFDTSIAGSSVETEDVRELTSALWAFAENSAGEDELYGRPQLVRFVWGKHWNVPGIVASVAERLEYFSDGGAPRRSWLRMRLLRVAEPLAGVDSAATFTEIPPLPGPEQLLIPPEDMLVHETVGGGSMSADDEPDNVSGERPDELAYRYLGDPGAWRWVVAPGGIDDPLHVPPGTTLRIPPPSIIRGTA